MVNLDRYIKKVNLNLLFLMFIVLKKTYFFNDSGKKTYSSPATKTTFFSGDPRQFLNMKKRFFCMCREKTPCRAALFVGYM